MADRMVKMRGVMMDGQMETARESLREIWMEAKMAQQKVKRMGKMMDGQREWRTGVNSAKN